MRSHKHRRQRGKTRRREAPSVSIVGYTRFIDITSAVSTGTDTELTTVDIPDVVTPGEETVNRKVLSVTGQSFFTGALPADKVAVAQFCLWAHPKNESWPVVAKYDPFNDGPGETGFEGLIAPRTFGRRTMVLSTPSSGVAQTISAQHLYKTRSERLLRPGWVLSAGLYTRADSGVSVRFSALLRAVVAG